MAHPVYILQQVRKLFTLPWPLFYKSLSQILTSNWYFFLISSKEQILGCIKEEYDKDKSKFNNNKIKFTFINNIQGIEDEVVILVNCRKLLSFSQSIFDLLTRPRKGLIIITEKQSK